MKKKTVDLATMVCLLITIVSGFMLHVDVHHRHVYNNSFLWGLHETVGLILAVGVMVHCVQHKNWFKNYGRIPAKKKHVTTVLLSIFVVSVISGVILMCGSQSEEISILHYVIGIAFTLIAVGHVAKRWKIFSALH